jgi:hypothetical protein
LRRRETYAIDSKLANAASKGNGGLPSHAFRVPARERRSGHFAGCKQSDYETQSKSSCRYVSRGSERKSDMLKNSRWKKRGRCSQDALTPCRTQESHSRVTSPITAWPTCRPLAQLFPEQRRATYESPCIVATTPESGTPPKGVGLRKINSKINSRSELINSAPHLDICWEL